MGERKSAYWLRTALLTAAVAAWQIYDMATAVEAPSRALQALQYSLLTLALVSCIGSTVFYIKGALSR